MDLAEACYKAAQLLPRKELFGIASQIERSSVSIPANIAEGYGRRYTGDYVHHLSIANGSLKELETHLLLAQRLGYLSGEVVGRLLAEADVLGRMLTTLIRKLVSKQRN